MSARVVSVPDPQHQCSPGWDEHYVLPGAPGPLMPDIGGWRLRRVHHDPGTVVECACGKTWVALEHIYTGTRIGRGIVHGGWNDYAPETRRQRRRRLRTVGE